MGGAADFSLTSSGRIWPSWPRSAVLVRALSDRRSIGCGILSCVLASPDVAAVVRCEVLRMVEEIGAMRVSEWVTTKWHRRAWRSGS